VHKDKQMVSLTYSSVYTVCRLKVGVREKQFFRLLLVSLQFNLPGTDFPC